MKYKKTKEYHGMTKTRVYRIWRSMVQRTKNEKNPNFLIYKKNNQGEVVKIDDTWLSFTQFYKDMGDDNGLTIDRIDNTKGYSKENCRWATPKEQVLNRKNYGKFSRGVHKDFHRFHARIWYEGKTHYIGAFPTEKLAALAFESCYFALYAKYPPA